MNKKSTNNQAGKGDAPRSCFSLKYRENYDLINWNQKNIENDKQYVEKIKNKPELYIPCTKLIN
jgi:hypothetical protein